MEKLFPDFLQSYTKIHDSIKLPTLVTDMSLNILWSNQVAKSHFAGIIHNDFFDNILSNEQKSKIIKSIKNDKTISIRQDILSLCTATISFTPMNNNMKNQLSKSKKVDSREENYILVLFTILTEDNIYTKQDTHQRILSFESQIRSALSDTLTAVNAIKNKTLTEKTTKFNPYLMEITSSSYKILRIYELISEYARYQSGTNDFNLENVNIREFFEKFLYAVQFIVQENQNVFNYNVEVPKDKYFKIDKHKFVNAYLQIISNSLKFSDDMCKINVTITQNNDNVIIKTSDNAKGVSKEMISNVFKPYFCYNGYNPYDSVGLGLTVLKENITKLGGTIALTSQENYGTTVAISLESYSIDLNEDDNILGSFSSELMLDKFSPIYVQLCDKCNPPIF